MIGLETAGWMPVYEEGPMMKISGAFVYQPPSEDGGIPARFAISLCVLNDDGTAVFPTRGNLPEGALGLSWF